MLGRVKFLLVASLLLSGVANAGYLCSYSTTIDDSNKYNTSGGTLKSAADIIQQERADFHNGGVSYGDDDCYFDKKANRMKIAEMLSVGKISPKLSKHIVNGNPSIQVDIYSTHINVNYYNQSPKP